MSGTAYSLGRVTVTIWRFKGKYRYLVSGEGYNSWERDPANVGIILESLASFLEDKRKDAPSEPPGVACSICHRTNQDGKPLRPGVEVDGEPRGPLCNPCKSALAQMGNDPSRLLASVRYLSTPDDAEVADADLVQG